MHFWLFLGSFSWFFQERCFVESCGFLRCVQCPKTLNLSYQKQHLEIFSNFSPKGGSLTVKKLPGAEKKVKKNFKKKNLKDWTKWNRKMGGRSCFITSGAFGHGLPDRLDSFAGVFEHSSLLLSHCQGGSLCYTDIILGKLIWCFECIPRKSVARRGKVSWI